MRGDRQIRKKRSGLISGSKLFRLTIAVGFFTISMETSGSGSSLLRGWRNKTEKETSGGMHLVF